MCRPLRFGFNEQTGSDNEFQHKPSKQEAETVLTSALSEFDNAVNQLTEHGVEVLVLEHPEDLHVPDAVFPNNWFTTHSDGTVLLYPMKTANRKIEVIPQKLNALLENSGYRIKNIEDITESLNQNQILEGTGAIIFDHEYQQAYTALSDRCEQAIVEAYCQKYGWQSNIFNATSSHGKSVYHTNVVMSIGSEFAVICGESIAKTERTIIFEKLESCKKKVIDISFEQMERYFCGNILEVKNSKDETTIVMSQSAWRGFNTTQRKQLENLGHCLINDVHTIEHIGGGSMRCMMAENFLPSK
ncbi:citrulline utilization hydrolase CtlX [Pleionea sediminis]|uniref:citrulline utilization hydrolase CtlX n=1 Tax=Pleionea sediminis TaxID=2569479 RepID=UPI001FEBB475|nr:arginine deiminase-related protein [Pleionea sediminis]